MRVVIRSFFSLRIISKVFFFFFQAWKAMAGEEDIIPGGRFVLDSAKLTVPFAVHARERSRSVISAVCTSEKKRTLSLFSSSSVERNRGGKNSGARLEVDDVLLPLLPFLLSSPLSSPSPFLLVRAFLKRAPREIVQADCISSRGGEREPTVESDYIVNTEATLPCLE